MPRKTTRDYIRYHADRALVRLDQSLLALHKLDDLGGQQSVYIEVTLPQIVAGFEALKQALEAFKEGL